MNLPSDKTRGIMDRAKAYDKIKWTKNTPMDNPLNMEDGMLGTKNTVTCPICKAKESKDQPQAGTHCYTIKYECGTEIGIAIWQGGHDPEYHFSKRCDEPKPEFKCSHCDGNGVGHITHPCEEYGKVDKRVIIKPTSDRKDILYMEIANVFSKMSKCVSKQVGCVIVKDGRVISSGYNGTPKGCKNCNEIFDKDNFDRTEHHKFSEEFELHGELNALLFAARDNVSVEGATLYCTLQPCLQCIKNITQSGIKRVVFRDMYDLNTYTKKTLEMLDSASIVLERIEK